MPPLFRITGSVGAFFSPRAFKTGRTSFAYKTLRALIISAKVLLEVLGSARWLRPF